MIKILSRPEVILQEDKFKPLISKALEHANSEITLDYVLKCIYNSDMIIIYWTDGEAELIELLEIVVFPSGKRVVNLIATSGEGMLDCIDDMLEKFDDVARMYHCEELYAIGRMGWKKILESKGFEFAHVMLKRKVGV